MLIRDASVSEGLSQQQLSMSMQQDFYNGISSTNLSNGGEGFSDGVWVDGRLWEFCDKLWIHLLAYVDFEDVMKLSRTCKRLRWLLGHEMACRIVPEVRTVTRLMIITLK